ncbi:hypothetical protein LRAMOSA09035 [Lichtheimia ramosa]|uniref:Kinetochore protein Spc24 n=1 Tax=Lichtheimia ramosa TaxID=688394 RepID=A0A077WIU4_9FUNG|nr:hypothetical protein LRAMOSA09035 [Lichtheimia ramosa]
MATIPDTNDDPLSAIRQARSALESLRIQDTVNQINDNYNHLQAKIEEQRQEEQRIEQGKRILELQHELDMLKQQVDDMSKSHDLEALDREREKLQEDTRVVMEQRQALEVQVQDYKQQLHDLEAKEMVSLSKDSYSLLMMIYRGLGVKAIREDDGSINKLQLTSMDEKQIKILDLSIGYSPYFLAEKIWKYISPLE